MVVYNFEIKLKRNKKKRKKKSLWNVLLNLKLIKMQMLIFKNRIMNIIQKDYMINFYKEKINYNY